MGCVFNECCSGEIDGVQAGVCESQALQGGFSFMECADDVCDWDKCMRTVGHAIGCFAGFTDVGAGCGQAGQSCACLGCGVGCQNCKDDLVTLVNSGDSLRGHRFLRAMPTSRDAAGRSLFDIRSGVPIITPRDVSFERANCYEHSDGLQDNTECFGMDTCECWPPLPSFPGTSSTPGCGDNPACPGGAGTALQGMEPHSFVATGPDWPPEEGELEPGASVYCKRLYDGGIRVTRVDATESHQTVFISTGAPCTSNLLVAAAAKVASASNCDSVLPEAPQCADVVRGPVPYMQAGPHGSVSCRDFASMVRCVRLNEGIGFDPDGFDIDAEWQLRQNAVNMVFDQGFPAPGNDKNEITFNRLEHEGHVLNSNTRFGWWSRVWDSVEEGILDASLPVILQANASTTRYGCTVAVDIVATKVEVSFNLVIHHVIGLQGHSFAPYVVGGIKIHTGIIATGDTGCDGRGITIVNGTPVAVPPVVWPLGNELIYATEDAADESFTVPDVIEWRGMLNATTGTQYSLCEEYGGTARLQPRKALKCVGEFEVRGLPTTFDDDEFETAYTGGVRITWDYAANNGFHACN